MAMYSQKNRPLAVHTPLGEDVLLLEGVRGSEGLSELFHFQLDVLADKRAAIPFQRLLGQPAGVRLTQADGGVRHLHGLIQRVEQGRPDAEFLPLRLHLVPRLWLYGQNRRCRIFQQQSVADIAAKVLQDLGGDLVLDLHARYQPRDYCVQYQESDVAFLSRLFEEEGIFYWFRHHEDRHVLVLSDYSPGLAALADPAMRFGKAAPLMREVRLFEWSRAQELRPGTFVTWDQCFELTRQDHGFQNLEARQQMRDSIQVGSVPHTLKLDVMTPVEVYDYPGGYAKRFDSVDRGGKPQPENLGQVVPAGAQAARLRVEEEAARSLTVRGTSNRAQLTPGYHFQVVDDVVDAGSYLAVRVEHEARGQGYRSGEEPSFQYQNSFTCLPAELPYRSVRRGVRPTISGVQTATVVGDKAVSVDKYGRVKVQFHWDREGKYNLDSSCWIRVAQVWAGKRWGAFFWPRPGQEVVVAFEDGDPDRPLIVGSVYNAANMPPFELPQNTFAAGIKSCSLDGDPQRDFNGVIFHDEKDDEHLQLHSASHEVHTSTKSRVERTRGQRVAFSGSSSLSAVGSGSGGGSFGWGSSISLVDVEDAGEMLFGLSPLHYLNFVNGNGLNVNMRGSSYTHIMSGNDNTIVFDPLRLIMAIPGVADTLGRVGRYGSALFLKGGGKQLYNGSKSEQVYFGPKVDICRCRVYNYHGLPFPVTPVSPTDWAAQLLTIFLGVALYTVHEIADELYDVGNDEKAAPEWYLVWPTFISSKVHTVLMLLEKAMASAQATEDKAAEAADQAALAATHLEVIDKIAMAAGMSEMAALEVERRILDGYGTAEDTAAFLLAQSQGSYLVSNLPKEQYHYCPGNYSIRARDVSIISAAPTDYLGPTSINLDARGKDGVGGTISMSASSQAKLCAGGAFVCVASGELTDELAVHVPTEGTLILSAGDLLTTPQISLGGLTQEIVLSVDLSTITINALGITASFGDGVASISLNAEGITLQYGDSAITLNATGVSIEGPVITSTADLANAITGDVVEIEAGESYTVTAPLSEQA